jgi:hypothetical protein
MRTEPPRTRLLLPVRTKTELPRTRLLLLAQMSRQLMRRLQPVNSLHLSPVRRALLVRRLQRMRSPLLIPRLHPALRPGPKTLLVQRKKLREVKKSLVGSVDHNI